MTTPAGQPNSWIDRFSGYIAILAVLVFVGSIILSNLDIPRQVKIIAFLSSGISILLAILGVIIFINRQHPFAARLLNRLAWTGNLLALLLAIGIFALAPMLLLGEPNRGFVLKIEVIIALSLLPGWLYLQFIAVKGQTLRDEYILNLHRLHLDSRDFLPPAPQGSLWNPRDLKVFGPPDPSKNLYLQKFVGLYGEFGGSEIGRPRTSKFQAENLLPVIVTTIIMAIGWSFVLDPAAILSYQFTFGITLTEPLSSLELPSAALKYGFLGSYFFVLQMLVRRYFQDDLKTTAYIHSLIRVITVALLVVALSIVWQWSQPQLLAFAFVIGIFPQVALQALQKLAV